MSRSGSLGQYFTPRPVVEFALDALELLGVPISGARAVDPACGPGEWLRAALARGAEFVTGADCDPAMSSSWREGCLDVHPQCRLIVADGLLPHALPAASFDIAMGNPPFGGKLPDAREETLRLLARTYELLYAPAPRRLLHEPSTRDLRQLLRFPVELLFLERFVTLCRPGGAVAIILPEGVLSNARWRRVRAWLLQRVTLHAVVGLPRETFGGQYTRAKTCLLLARNHPSLANHRVALCEVASCDERTFEALLAAMERREEILAGAPPGLLPPPALRPQ
ncbi:MAG: class I SAM-dependent DNA methyltransferase [Armatimonadota bacterium]